MSRHHLAPPPDLNAAFLQEKFFRTKSSRTSQYLSIPNSAGVHTTFTKEEMQVCPTTTVFTASWIQAVCSRFHYFRYTAHHNLCFPAWALSWFFSNHAYRVQAFGSSADALQQQHKMDKQLFTLLSTTDSKMHWTSKKGAGVQDAECTCRSYTSKDSFSFK